MKILEITKEYRKKLLTRFKNLRSYKRYKGHKRWKKNILGGIVVFEMTINLYPETQEVEFHPHLHAILHGRYYTQKDLQEDWGLGIADIRMIENQWIAQLEVAKYIGKDGSRRTSFGSVRKAKRDLSEAELQNKSQRSSAHLATE